MKRLIIGLVVAGFTGVPVQAGEPWMDASVAALSKEKKIREVLFSNDRSTSLWISVRDDGSRRDGFAESACVTLMESGMPVGAFTVIRIWDAAAMARGEQRELGRFECSRKG
ncbi:Hypothetical protein NGAL_HAMBI2605_10410 [Neorhizobium galegae bv. orientalis]|nr:Hypothetical protein NGAL_HAMBI2605_10410 [Neorhizobium galegae bv. orientalis]